MDPITRQLPGGDLRAGGDLRPGLPDVPGDAVDVVDRLAKGRHAVVLPDVTFSSVVCGDGEVGVPVERLQQPAQVTRAGVLMVEMCSRVSR